MSPVEKFLEDRIAATQALITVYEDALTAIGTSGATQSYTLDTGQSRQVVTRGDISQLNSMLDTLYNRLATLNARVNGAGYVASPDW